MRELIPQSVKDCVADLLYYGRKEDEELPLGAIEEAVKSGEVTAGQMVAVFADALTGHLVDQGALPPHRKTDLAP